MDEGAFDLRISEWENNENIERRGERERDSKMEYL